tara:strand:- start:125 stop:334 length:210 start_codon:yes stop_codon:yes gene_type:complete
MQFRAPLLFGQSARLFEGGNKMRKKPELVQLLELALKEATAEKRYCFVACYLRAALETAQESKEIKKPS